MNCQDPQPTWPDDLPGMWVSQEFWDETMIVDSQPEWPPLEEVYPEKVQGPSVRFSAEDFALLLELVSESRYEVNHALIHEKVPMALKYPATCRVNELRDLMEKIQQLPDSAEFIVNAK